MFTDRPGRATSFSQRCSQRARRNAYGKLHPMQIGELLIREGHLTQEGLEEALDWQVLYGGRLGTNLLELRVVEEKHLAQALGRQLGCETAWGDLELPPEMIPLGQFVASVSNVSRQVHDVADQ